MIPKAELHCHLEGAARPAIVRRLAARNDVDLSRLFDEDGGYRSHDFSSFLAAYDEVVQVFQTPEDYADLAEDHFAWLGEQGAIYGEIFLSPSHTHKLGMGWTTLLDAVAEGIARANALSGIEGRVIATGVRHYGPVEVGEAAQTVVGEPHPLVTGFGLAGDERMHHPSDFELAFRTAGEAGLGLTAHAGEFGGPESVIDAIDHLGIVRVGHGVRAAEDESVLDRIVAEEIVLEICPGSNVALQVYASPEEHPFGKLWDAGAQVTLNSDDPPFFHTSLENEYAFARDVKGLTDEDLREVTRIALRAAFVDEETRRALLAKVDAAP